MNRKIETNEQKDRHTAKRHQMINKQTQAGQHKQKHKTDTSIDRKIYRQANKQTRIKE